MNEYPYSEVAREEEIGSTSGQTHAKVIEGVIGRERMLENLTSSGPPSPQRLRAPIPAPTARVERGSPVVAQVPDIAADATPEAASGTIPARNVVPEADAEGAPEPAAKVTDAPR